MAVFLRRYCTACKHEERLARAPKHMPPCVRCGAATRLSPQWYVAVRVRTAGGLKQVTRAVSAKKAEAEAEERRLLGERDGGVIVQPGKHTTFAHGSKVFIEWVEDRKDRGELAEGSARSYLYRLSAHLEAAFAGTDMRAIDHNAADAYVKLRRKSGCRPASINREVATLKRLLSIAVKKRLLQTNPLQGYELLPENNERDLHLTREQVSTLLAEAQKAKYPEHLHPILVAALNTGLRREGVLTLRWEEIDWKGNEIVKVVKGGTTVRVPMTTALRACLDARRTRGGVTRAQGWVFPSPKKEGAPMLITSRIGFETACKAAGLSGLHFHDLRHTFATLFLEQFPDQIETLRGLLGHTSSHITRRYAHLTDRTRHEAIKKFDIGG